jgi:hypothetical protein
MGGCNGGAATPPDARSETRRPQCFPAPCGMGRLLPTHGLALTLIGATMPRFPARGWQRRDGDRSPAAGTAARRGGLDPDRPHTRYSARFPRVRWQSGDAADCKSAYVGSIPARTSIFSMAQAGSGGFFNGAANASGAVRRVQKRNGCLRPLNDLS